MHLTKVFGKDFHKMLDKMIYITQNLQTDNRQAEIVSAYIVLVKTLIGMSCDAA